MTIQKPKRDRIAQKVQKDISYSKVCRCNANGRITFYNYIKK